MDEVVFGDALEVIPDLGEFDAVITDPPYSVNASQFRVGEKGAVIASKMALSMQRSFVAGVMRVIRKNEKFASWIFTDWHNISYLGEYMKGMGLSKQVGMIWDKTHANMNASYHCRCELCLYSANYTMNGTFYGQEIIAAKKPMGGKRTHPFEKPPEFTEQALKAFKPGRILDPFCGTGGLLVGAKKLGWEVVGIDMVQEFVDIANERLRETEGALI